jgi:aryl-alcohol dehydrogenase-like predicted oxidoreductase
VYVIIDVIRPIAAAHGASMAQVALAWVLAQDAVTSVIIGARTPAQLEDNLKAVDCQLSPSELQALDEVSKLTTEYPAWMDVLPSDRRPGEERQFKKQ